MKIFLILFLILVNSIQANESILFDTNTKEFTITNTTKTTVTIDVANLIIGQSGIIVNNSNKTSLIVANAVVVATTNKNTTLKILASNNLKQDAIPTSTLKPKNGDILVLNHMYNSSLLITPNYETSQEILELYPKQNFLNPDIFASHLKISHTPIPTIKEMKNFCLSYDIGTIFISVDNKLYILDVNSLNILHNTTLTSTNKETQSPFFTKVMDIEKEFWDFGDDKIKDYNKYYTKILGL